MYSYVQHETKDNYHHDKIILTHDELHRVIIVHQ